MRFVLREVHFDILRFIDKPYQAFLLEEVNLTKGGRKVRSRECSFATWYAH